MNNPEWVFDADDVKKALEDVHGITIVTLHPIFKIQGKGATVSVTLAGVKAEYVNESAAVSEVEELMRGEE